MSIEIYGHKHMLQCSCIVPGLKQTIFFEFPVFSLCGINEKNENAFITKYVSCPNCAAIHFVTNFCQSQIVSRNKDITILSIDDIRLSVPNNICLILDSYNADLATWEEVRHIVLSKLKNVSVTLKIESIGNVIHGKKLMFLDDSVVLSEISENIFISNE